MKSHSRNWCINGPSYIIPGIPIVNLKRNYLNKDIAILSDSQAAINALRGGRQRQEQSMRYKPSLTNSGRR
ncbi:GH22351 [Drosophila grimshawi]|uniref:GH22351 n=1 Tax=Drosophila grimshawi TaxID=7222 RepID=B4JYS5_DROGR|nr:GH22351 [Drosophila grimshawi]